MLLASSLPGTRYATAYRSLCLRSVLIPPRSRPTVSAARAPPHPVHTALPRKPPHPPKGDNVKIQTQRVIANLRPSEAPPSTFSVAKRIWQGQGLRGFFCCLDGQLMRDGLFYGIFFGGYKALKRSLTSFLPGVPEQPITFVSGGLAGMLSWVAVLPVDGPKSIVQVGLSTGGIKCHQWLVTHHRRSCTSVDLTGNYVPTLVQGGWQPPTYPGAAINVHGQPQLFGAWRLAFVHVLRTRGASGLYAGLPVMVARSFPAQGSLFLGYETARSALG